jgi:hypothetical protein
MRSTLEVDWPLMQNGLDFTAITGAERTYDQLVAALDAQYGSSSSNGDTGIEGARRDASISTRDAQYYASRDTSWAITLSGSTTLNNTPWTLRATSVAKAQANFSTSRATAQAAHDAALLGALEEWRGSSGASSLKSLVSSSRAENDFKSSVAGFWADWNMATEGIDREAPTGFFGSMTDSVMGLMNPFDTDNLAKSFTTEAKPDTTNGPQRPKPSDIHVVYSIYGIVSEHTPEEWEVIREHQTKGRTWEEWMMGGERKRMDAAGFKTSFRKLEEDVPPAKVVPTPTVPSPPPVVPALSNPILTPLDANSELMVSRDDSGLGIFDSIIGMIGGTKGDFVDESFNFTYGVGDNMSLGLGWWLRSTFFHDQADYGGSSYYIGSWVGFAGDLLMGVGAFKALGKTFGREALESGLRNAPKGGFGMFGRNVPPPSGPPNPWLRDLFIKNAESPVLRARVDLFHKAVGRSPVDWDGFMAKLRNSDFNDYASFWRESRKSLGFADSGPNGWQFGLSKLLRNVPGVNNSAVRHELFHAVDDLTTGLFSNPRTLGLWFRAEAGAHIVGGPLIGLVGIPGLAAGSFYVGWWIRSLQGNAI